MEDKKEMKAARPSAAAADPTLPIAPPFGGMEDDRPVEAPETAGADPEAAISAGQDAPSPALVIEPLPEPKAEAAPAEPERLTVCDVQFRSGGKLYFFDPGELSLKNGDHLILDTFRGAEFGYCVIGNHRIAARELGQPLRRVLRLATPIDERIKADNEKREKEAFAFCLRKVEELGLDMQLVSVECAFDGSKLLFFFTADARVDFRELVKVLASAYHTRIELRQIGVRDKAKMLGGLGICGRPFCCAGFLSDFEPVSIKMAKTQNLSLNPTKISGACGRLMCCLKYEQDAYEDLIRTSPKAESFVDTPEGRGTVTEVNLMRQSVSVRMEKDPEEIRCFKNDDICVLRSGKARKNDPPIPDDLAPISGRLAEDPLSRLSRVDQRLVLSAEEEESAFSEEGPEPEPEQKQGRRNRRDRNRRRDGRDAGTESENAPEKPDTRDGRSQGSDPRDARSQAKDGKSQGNDARDGRLQGRDARTQGDARDAGGDGKPQGRDGRPQGKDGKGSRDGRPQGRDAGDGRPQSRDAREDGKLQDRNSKDTGEGKDAKDGRPQSKDARSQGRDGRESKAQGRDSKELKAPGKESKPVIPAPKLPADAPLPIAELAEQAPKSKKKNRRHTQDRKGQRSPVQDLPAPPEHTPKPEPAKKPNRRRYYQRRPKQGE